MISQISIVLVTTLVGTMTVGHAQPPQPTTRELPTSLTLSQAIDLALRLQPNIAVAFANREQAEQQEKGAKARYFPTITPTYTYLNQYNFGTINQFLGNGIIVPVQSGQSSTNKQLQVGFSYRLYDSGVRDLNSRSARQSLHAQRYAEQNSRQTVIFTVADAYFSVLRNEELVKVSEAQIERAKNTLDVIKAQVEARVAAPKDTFQAEADYLNAQVNLLSAQNNAAVAQANLKQAIGLVGRAALRLASLNLPTAQTPWIIDVPIADPGVTGTPTPASDISTLDALTETAFQTRPDVAQSLKSLELSKTTVRQNKVNAGLILNVDLSANEQYEPSDFDRNIGRNRQFNLSASYPLFDGGLVRSQVRSSQAGVQASEAQLLSVQQQVAVDVEQAYRNLRQARAAIPAAQAAQAAAQVNYDAALESRKEGVGSIVEVITAQTSLVQAQTNYVQAVYDFYTADARLARAIGQAERIAQIASN